MMNDVHMVAYAVILTWAMVNSAAMIRTNGNLVKMIGNRDDLPPPSPLAERADRAAKNMLENMVLFLGAYIAAKASGAHGWQIVRGTQIFVAARLAYWLIYLAGIKGLRTAVWLVGLCSTGVVVSAALI